MISKNIANIAVIISLILSTTSIMLVRSYAGSAEHLHKENVQRINIIDDVVEDLFKADSIKEIRDTVKNIQTKHDQLDKKTTVVLIKLDKVLEVIHSRQDR